MVLKITILIVNLFYLMFQQTCDQQNFITCKFVTTLSIEHDTGEDGAYSNFYKNDLNQILGRTDWYGETFQIFHNRKGLQNMKFWDIQAGGSIGDAHSRFNNDPVAEFGNKQGGNFQVGDIIMFIDYPPKYSGIKSNCLNYKNSNILKTLQNGTLDSNFSRFNGYKGPASTDAHYFDSKNYLNIAPVVVGQSLTVSVWVNFYDVDFFSIQRGYQRILQITDEDQWGNTLICLTTYQNIVGKLYILYYANGVKYYNIYDNAWEQNKYSHYLVQFEQNSTNNGITVYQNGQLLTPSTSDNFSSSNIISFTGNYSNIGRGQSTRETEKFFGMMDELIIYSDILSAQERDCLRDICVNKCLTCQYSSDNCLTCRGDRLIDQNCECPIQKYDTGLENCEQCPFEGCLSCSNNLECDICAGDQGQPYSRIINQSNGKNECICPQKYFSDINIQFSCIECLFEGCLSCSNNIECDSCVGDQGQPYSRIINQQNGKNECICPPKYFSNLDIQLSCIACDFKCSECAGNSSKCTSCIFSRNLDINCDCPDGYFDDLTNPVCQSCEQGCQICNQDECLTCKANRIKQGKLCDCNEVNYLSHDFTDFCTSCTVDVLQYVMSKNYTQIIIQFPDEISTNIEGDISIFSKELCQKIFEQESLDLIGEGPQCKFDLINFQIKINLGVNPIIVENQEIQIKNGIIQRTVCGDTDFIQQFPENTLQYHQDSLPPSAIFTNIGSSISLCSDISIQVVQIFNDGNRGLYNFQWTREQQTTATNNTVIDQIILLANQEKQSYLNIPALTLQEFKDYKISVYYENFIGKYSTYTIDFSTQSTSGIQANIIQLKPFIFTNFKDYEIESNVQFLDCSNNSFQQIEKLLEIKWEDITNLNNVIELKNTESKEQQQFYNIQKYTSIPGQTYKLRLNIKVPQKPIETSLELKYEITKSKLMSYIQGGNRLQAYAENLQLQGVGYDPDVQPSDQKLNIQQSWTCLDMSSQEQCQTIEGIQLVFNNTETAEFLPKQFEPYNSLLFSYKIDKQNKESQTGVAIIVIVETNLPLLLVSVPESFQTQKININDDLQISIDYDGDPDEVFFSLIFLYKLDVVATKSFSYTTFAFKIWDIFSDFQQDESQLLLRVSMYDPKYFMPSQSNFNLELNFQPQLGTLSVNPLQGYSMETDFTITLENFRDEDQPLTYKYQYYFSQNQYLQERKNGDKNVKLNKNTLIDYTKQNLIVSQLPQGNFNIDNNKNEIMLMVSVKDSLGAITNITQIIEIQNNPNILFSQKLDNLESKINNIEQKQIEEQILQLNILAAEITRFGVQDCLNDCSGNGQCDQILKKCNCNGNYFLQDCSQNQDFQKYALLQKSIYDKLQGLVDQTSSQVLKDQIIKSVNSILELSDISTLLESNDIISNFDSQQQIISKQEILINQIIDSGQIYQGDNIITTKYNNIQEILGKSIENVNSSIKSIQKSNQKGRRILNEQEQKQAQQQIVEISKKSSKLLQKIILPNSDPIQYQGEELSLNIQKLTQKNMESQYFTDDSQNLIKPKFKDNLNQVESDIDNQQDQLQNQVYDSNLYSYKKNPYILESQFPYPDQNNPVYNVEIQNTKNLEDNEYVDINQENIQIDKQIVLQFDSQDNQENQKCLTKNQNQEGWNFDSCTTEEKNNDDGSNVINCKCQKLEPATLVNDINNLFENSLADQVYSEEGLKKLLAFKFYESIIFYIITTKTIILLIIVYIGYKLDKKQSKQILNKNVDQTQDLQVEVLDENQSQKNEKNITQNININNIQIQHLNVQQVMVQKQSSINQDDVLDQNMVIEGIGEIKKRKRKIKKIKSFAKNNDLQINNNENDNKIENINNQEIENNNTSNNFVEIKQKDIQIGDSNKQNDNSQDNKSQNIQDNQEENKNQQENNNLQIENEKNDFQLQNLVLDNMQNIQNNDNLESSRHFNQNLKMEISNKSSKDKFLLKNAVENEQIDKNQNEEQKSLEVFKEPVKKENLKSVSEGIIRFHEFFTIFFIYNEKISRPVRFSIYYIQITMLIAISGLFSQNLSQMQSIYLSILSSIIIAIPIAIVEKLYQSKNFIVKGMAIMILIITQLFIIYTIIITAAVMGVDQSNTWVQSYSYSFILQFFVINPIKVTFMLLIIKQGLLKGKQLKFLDPKIKKSMMDFLYPARK